jgi:hypothetical protein
MKMVLRLLVIDTRKPVRPRLFLLHPIKLLIPRGGTGRKKTIKGKKHIENRTRPYFRSTGARRETELTVER